MIHKTESLIKVFTLFAHYLHISFKLFALFIVKVKHQEQDISVL